MYIHFLHRISDTHINIWQGSARITVMIVNHALGGFDFKWGISVGKYIELIAIWYVGEYAQRVQ